MFRNRYVGADLQKWMMRPFRSLFALFAYRSILPYRKNSQKPDDELITRFQKTFQDVVPPVTARNAARFGQGPVGPITPAR
ncbi:uncharacterized protein BP01DRAFT_361272 [Aspergillus saccharolyticus JOP 1030-1]|uniref:Uncharacterized protein n=1 Tax=Aspergillus saccharolyticus JOP 1030-1 TaxID=1450539 RepID=A0A318YZL5_9EURO|nr:hypothetical protein BP01DRAFT_361272 [Aspergillus saccharolyticus JOP 1030-1]PYH40425.1 hypothetical protein BP01DRAFT_361272 [Aspergillus saccharolyticus JOP 1030-1]